MSINRLNQHRLSYSKPFSCSHCNKSFGKRWNLKIHERIHNKQQNMDTMKRCKFCDKKFHEPSSLKKHIKNIHSISNCIALNAF